MASHQKVGILKLVEPMPCIPQGGLGGMQQADLPSFLSPKNKYWLLRTLGMLPPFHGSCSSTTTTILARYSHLDDNRKEGTKERRKEWIGSIKLRQEGRQEAMEGKDKKKLSTRFLPSCHQLNNCWLWRRFLANRKQNESWGTGAWCLSGCPFL